MNTNPNSERDTLSNERKEEFIEPLFLTKNDTHPQFDIWALVYYTDDPAHVPVTVTTFTPKGVNEIVFRLPK
jgi:hypothetical protein